MIDIFVILIAYAVKRIICGFSANRGGDYGKYHDCSVGVTLCDWGLNY